MSEVMKAIQAVVLYFECSDFRFFIYFKKILQANKHHRYISSSSKTFQIYIQYNRTVANTQLCQYIMLYAINIISI